MNEWKNKKQNIYHADLNVILMVENVTQIKTGVTINVSVSVKIKKKASWVCENDYTWNPATSSCENGKYVRSIIENTKLKIVWIKITTFFKRRVL